MIIDTFEELHFALSVTLGEAVGPLMAHESGSMFEIRMDMRRVMVHCHAGDTTDCVMVMIARAQPEPRNEQAVLTDLMEDTFIRMTDDGSPAWSRDAATGELCLRYAYPFAGTRSRDFLERLTAETSEVPA